MGTPLRYGSGEGRAGGAQRDASHSVHRAKAAGGDHAGVGDYYGTYDAQNIFDNFTAEEIGIVPLKFEHAAYSKKAQGMVSSKTFPKLEGDQIFLSGTKVRALLEQGERPPAEFSRPEVADVLIEWATATVTA